MIPKVLYQFKDRAGTPFQPSNGTEGMIFCEKFCDQCLNCRPNPDKEPQCEILMLTMCFSTRDKEYPSEWIFDEEGWPVCTAWQNGTGVMTMTDGTNRLNLHMNLKTPAN